MNKSIKKFISYFILVTSTIFTYVIIVNYSSQYLYNPTYIEKELEHISVTDIINSSIFDKDSKMLKIRKNIDSIYSVADILDISKDKITGLINSKISTDVITKIVVNVMDTLITGHKQELFDINDYNQIVDNNLDLILTEINLNLSYEEKLILSKILKEVGEKIIKDVPSTDLVIEKLDSHTLTIIKLISSKQVRDVFIIVDIVLWIILIFLNLNRNVLKYLLKELLVLLGVLLVTVLIIFKFSKTFNNEWLFIRRIILYFNYNLIINMIYIVMTVFVLFVIHCMIKRKAH